MNWIILLLLLGRCGGRDCNHCAGSRNQRSCGNPCADLRSGRDRRSRAERSDGCGCAEDRNDCSCRAEAKEAAREAVREAREAVRDAREAVREAREQSGCENSDMVPPPWQDYPPMPRREHGCD